MCLQTFLNSVKRKTNKSRHPADGFGQGRSFSKAAGSCRETMQKASDSMKLPVSFSDTERMPSPALTSPIQREIISVSPHFGPQLQILRDPFPQVNMARFALCDGWSGMRRRQAMISKSIMTCMMAGALILPLTGAKILLEAAMGVSLFARAGSVPFRVLPSVHLPGLLAALTAALPGLPGTRPEPRDPFKCGSK